MKKLHFDYLMQTEYSDVVYSCNYVIKCIPQDTLRQKLISLRVTNCPENKYSEGTDSFGNKKLYGCIEEEHSEFIFRISGEIYTGLSDYDTDHKEQMLGCYRYNYGLTAPKDNLKAYFNSLEIKGDTNYEKSLFLMDRVYKELRYVPEVTDVNTSAQEAWDLKKGVCQDYSHILISLCRMAGIPARYVTGMLIGEGESHAWVEIFSDGKWYGLDPTNDIVVSDEHIKIGVGRDARDCEINRGIIIGGGKQKLKICVNVEEVN